MAIPTLQESLDNMYTSTWEHRKAQVEDNIFGATPFWFWMKEKGKLKTEQGGRFIMYPLEYGKNDTVRWVKRGSRMPLNDYEYLTEAKYDWNYIAASMTRFGVDEQQNRGKAQIIKLMRASMNNTENSLIDALEEDLFGSVTIAAGGNSIFGLQSLVPDDPTAALTGDYAPGGIDPDVYEWFRNKTATLAGTSFASYGEAAMRKMLNDVSQNRNRDRTDIIVCGQDPYEYYEDSIIEQKRIVNQKLGDAGFTNIEYKGIPMIWSPECDDRMYFLNTRFLYFIYDPAMNFAMTKWKDVPDQINDRAAQIIHACSFVITRRLCQGVIHTINTA